MPPKDLNSGQPEWLVTPWSTMADVTPNDSTDLAFATRGLWIGGAGSLRLTALDGGTSTFLNVPTGLFIGRIARVLATGTTCTGIIALW